MTSAPRKLLFALSHSSAGGAQEIWANVAQGLQARGHDVQLMAFYPLAETIHPAPATLPWNYALPAQPRSAFQAVGLLRALVKFMRLHRPDYVFTALPAANVIMPVAAFLARTKTKVVISHHSPVETHHPLLNRLDSQTGRLPPVAHIVSVSEAVAGSLDAKPGNYRGKRRTIYNALPPEIEDFVRDLAARHSPRTPRGRCVVAAGRLAEQKNYPVLIRAARHMPDVTIHIVGNGPDETELKQMAMDLGVADRIHFLGYRPRTETLKILADGDLFVQPSLFEGHSLALVEAAKLGLPLVVSDAPVQIEGVTAADGERCGAVVGVHDDVALARAILELLDDPAAYRDACAKAAKLADGLTYQSMINAYEAIVQP